MTSAFFNGPIGFRTIALALSSLMIGSGSWAQFPPVVDLADTTADVTILGAADLDHTGFGLTSGDYDGDGLNDFAVFSSGPLSDSTGAFIHIFWASSPLDTTIDLLTYPGDVSKILAPPGEAGFLSARITSGDFNSDGHDDIALGLPQQFTPLGAAGKVYIIFGSPSFPDTLDLGSPVSPITTVLPVAGGGWLGNMLATGDIDGDTYTDLVIGAPALWPGGQVYVIHGRSTFPPVIDLGQTQPGITRVIEYYLNQATGRGLACKDVDKDGFDDLLIGSPGNATGFREGTVTLLFGSNALPDTIELRSSTITAMGMKRFHGEYTHGQLGWRVAIGDLEGDGVEELILSAFQADPQGCDNCGEVYVISWDPNLPDSVHVGTTAVPIKRLIGSGTVTIYGRELVVGDVTGDGRDDILMTSKPDQFVPTDVGKVTVVYGSPNLPDTVLLATDPFVTRFLAEGRQDNFGRGLGVGDVNDDGIGDALIGAEGAFPLGRFASGIAYVFYGTDTATAVPPSRPPRLRLLQNYPNPFSTTTRIEYELRRPSPVTLTIYNVLGQRVARLVRPGAPSGHQTITWNGLDERGRVVPSGIYFYKLETRGFAQTKKMIILR